jgi:hypothetical protein
MRHPAFQYDGLKLREPRRFSGSAWITTLSVFDHFSAPLQGTNLRNTDDYSPIPTHLKFKSGIHDFSSCLPAGAQDGTGVGKDHSEFSACPLRLTVPVIVDRVTRTTVGGPRAGVFIVGDYRVLS